MGHEENRSVCVKMLTWGMKEVDQQDLEVSKLKGRVIFFSGNLLVFCLQVYQGGAITD